MLGCLGRRICLLLTRAASMSSRERLPGWYGRFHSQSMTFAHYDFKRGSFIHEHFHPQEEVYGVIEGELEVTIDSATKAA